MTMPTTPAPAPVASVAGAGDRPSRTETCIECWHPLSDHDTVSGVIRSVGEQVRLVVVGFVHVECAPRFTARIERFEPLSQLGYRIVPLV